MNAASYNHLQFLSCTLQSYSEPKGNTFQVRPWCFLSFMFFWLNSKHVFFRNEKILCSVEKTLCILTQPPFKAFRTTSHPAKANKQSFPTHGAQDIKKIRKTSDPHQNSCKVWWSETEGLKNKLARTQYSACWDRLKQQPQFSKHAAIQKADLAGPTSATEIINGIAMAYRQVCKLAY